MTNVNLPYYFGFRDYIWSSIFGGALILGYFVLGFAVMYGLIARYKGREFLRRWGMPRFFLTAFLFLNMLAVVIKMTLRHAFNVKYIWVTKWFNV